MNLVDEYRIRISSGLVNIDKKLDLDEDVKIILEGTVVKEEHNTNNDGTKSITYVIKATIADCTAKERETKKMLDLRI